jgi:hypothetical protein
MIENGIDEKNGLKILIVLGECPIGEKHETIPC